MEESLLSKEAFVFPLRKQKVLNLPIYTSYPPPADVAESSEIYSLIGGVAQKRLYIDSLPG